MQGNNRDSTGSKIVPLALLAELAAGHKSEGKRLVHCHGVFDLVHPGHIRHLEEAKRQGDVLAVTVTPDEYVNKGPGRPVFNQRLRSESVAALQCVDYVAINEWPTAVETIHLLQPDVYAKGSEYAQRESDITQKIFDEEQAILSVGGRIHFTNDITFSSSHLINNHFNILPWETEEWLRTFRNRYSADTVLGYLKSSANLKVLVVGEAIIDEYIFCEAIGKSTKDPILACQYIDTKAFAGGSLAIANHLAGFCKEVTLLTCLGESERREGVIREALLPNVRPVFVTKKGAPTIHKRRFVDQYSENKLLELYVMDDRPVGEEAEGELLESLAAALKGNDLVIAADYGHGMLTQATIASLCRTSRFLAVNTQTNAGNRGYNPISKYPRADYVCLASHEVSIETRIRDGVPHNMLLEVAQRIDCKRFTETLGKHGSLHYSPESGFTQVPAFAIHVSDRVGAGDALLALTSLLVVQNAPWDIVGFVGNVAGGQMVGELGNRVTVNRVSVGKHIISLMK